MKATYYQRGETLDYFPTENVENGAVVSLGTRIGVAAAPISAGEQGAVHVVGVFAMAKANTEEIKQGAAVYYDAAAEAITTTTDGPPPAMRRQTPPPPPPVCWSSCRADRRAGA